MFWTREENDPSSRSSMKRVYCRFQSVTYALKLLRSIIASIIYRSGHIGAIIASFSYYFKLIGNVITSICYHFSFIMYLLFISLIPLSK
jgi:hypothetical protein